MIRRRRLGLAMLWVVLAASSVIMLVPWFWTVTTSLTPAAEVFSGNLLPNPPTLEAYAQVLTLIPFGGYFLNSVVVTVTVVVLNVVFDTCAAYALAKLPLPGRGVIMIVLLTTLMIPMQVNIIPLYRMMVNVHNAVPWLGADTLSGIIAPSAVQVLGIFLMRQFFVSVPDSILEAARLDGAGEWSILRRVVLPISWPAIATLVIFTGLAAWNDFLWPLIVTGSDASRTLPVGLALLSKKNTVNWSETMAGTVLTALPMIVLFVILQRRFIEGLTAGSVKE
ncbi:MAG: carbohydrate ABC transporter permease [Microbacteriaceae bacterium]|nr:carbohydrate ABC transporter permease [Microbacteriaceae bacterium]